MLRFSGSNMLQRGDYACNYATSWLFTLLLSPCNLYVLFTSHFRLIYSGLRVNVLIESGHKICRQNHLSKIKLCDWPNKLDATSWQVLNTTESVGWTVSYVEIFPRNFEVGGVKKFP